jgi:uncharacterized protein YllA (UPF0747 family)
MVLVMSEKQRKKTEKMNLTLEAMFMEPSELINQKTRELSTLRIDFSKLKLTLHNQFDELNELASQIDPTFNGALKVQETKQLKGLEKLEKRLLKAEKKIHHEKLQRIIQFQQELFPGGGLQERVLNFSELYLEHGDELKRKLLVSLNPLEFDCKTIVF